MLRKLWSDEAGFIISAELVLVATILVIGLIVGMVSLRNQIVQELADVGQAIGSVSQSFAFAGTKGFPGCNGTCAWTDGSGYVDKRDFCQPASQDAGNVVGGMALDKMPSYDPQNHKLGDDPTGGET